MSSDSVISLAERRPQRAKPIGGGAIIGNDTLYIPMSKVASHEVQWAFRTTFELGGERECPLDGSFLEVSFDDEEPLGNVYEHEHGVTAQFAVGPSFWALINGAALSPTPFEIVIGFHADESGAVRDLSLSINRKQAD